MLPRIITTDLLRSRNAFLRKKVWNPCHAENAPAKPLISMLFNPYCITRSMKKAGKKHFISYSPFSALCMAATLFQVCCDTVLWVATLRGFFFVFRGPYFQDWRLRYAKKSCFVWTRLLWLMGIYSFVSNMNWRNSIFWTNSKFTKKLLWQWTKWEGSAGVNDASVA